MNGINLNSLRIFYEVATSKSFLEASNRLFISQPAVSKSISKLEEDLGIVLFYRANKGITLTSFGEVLYKYLKETKDLLQSCERVLVSMNNTEEGNIVIGVQSHIVRNFLMDKIDNFRLKHPKINITLIDLSTRALIEQLEEQKIDFIVDSSPIDTVYNNINIEPICKLNTCFIKSQKLEKEINKLEDLNEQNLILPTPRSSLRKNLNKILEAKEIGVKPILEFDTEELIIDAVRRNLGIGYVIENAIKYLVDAKIIDYVRVNYELPKIELNLLYITNYLPKVAKIFIEEEIKNVK